MNVWVLLFLGLATGNFIFAVVDKKHDYRKAITITYYQGIALICAYFLVV